MNAMNLVKSASESAAMFGTPEENMIDRKNFVHNLGWLLSQTREGVERCYLDEQDIVHVVYRGGHEQQVNVRLNSYAAIVREVADALR